MSEESLSPVMVNKRKKRTKNVKNTFWANTDQGAQREIDKAKLLKMIITFTTDIVSSIGKGRRESVYQCALKSVLVQKNLNPVSIEHPVPIMYNNERVGTGYLDILVWNMFFLEIKAVGKISEKDLLQTMAYSKDMGIVGVLVNFTQKLNPDNSIDIYLIEKDKVLKHVTV